MRDATEEFFDRLSQREHEHLFGDEIGTIRFDIEDDNGMERWYLVIRQGQVRVSREEQQADAVIEAARPTFDQLVSGDANMYSAWMRNEFRAKGDLRVASLFQRVVREPAGAHHPRTFARERRQRG